MLALAPLALLAAASVAAGEAADITIRADQVEASGISGESEQAVVTATGDVRAESGGLLLRAPKLVYERASRIATLDGGVSAVDGPLVLAADRLVLDLDAKALALVNGTLSVKKGVSGAQLRTIEESATPSATSTAGHNALLLRAERLARGPGNTFSADGVWLTTCDCQPTQTPFVAVTAGKVEVTPGDSALLHDWAFRLFGVRILPFDMPIPLSLPLSSRRTGVLFPRFTLSGPGGAGVELPVFVTLGDSADLTFRTRYFHGTDAAESRNEGLAGVRGFGEGVEARWRPAEDAIGAARVDLVRDTSLNAFGQERGWRTDGAVQHQQRLGGGDLAARGEILSDNAVLLDTNVAIERAQLPYLRSEATWARPLGFGGFSWESAAIQDLRGPAQSMPPGRLVRFPLSRTPATIAPLARAEISENEVVPATLLLAWEDHVRGLDLEAGRSPRFASQLSVAPTLPLLAGPAGALALDFGGRLQGLAPTDGPAFVRGGGFADVNGRVRIGRSFEGGWRHEIVPSFRVRALDGEGGFATDLFQPRLVAGVAPAPNDPRRAPQDELDMALPEGFLVQAVARLETTLQQGGGGALTLFAEQHASLWPLALAQVAFGGTAALPPRFWATTLTLSGAYDPSHEAFADAAVRVSSTVAGGHIALGARFLGDTLSDQLGRGLDLLFSPETRVATGVTPLRQADLSFDWPVGSSWRVQGGGLVAKAVTVDAPATQQYWAGAAYDAGGCARVSLQVRWTPALTGTANPFAFGFAFELGDVGQATAAAAAALTEPR